MPKGSTAASGPPQLDLSDPTLVRALDELAALGNEPTSEPFEDQPASPDVPAAERGRPDGPSTPHEAFGTEASVTKTSATDSSSAPAGPASVHEPSLAPAEPASFAEPASLAEHSTAPQPATSPQPVELPPLPNQPPRTVLPDGSLADESSDGPLSPSAVSELSALGGEAPTEAGGDRPDRRRARLRQAFWTVALVAAAVGGFLVGQRFAGSGSRAKSPPAAAASRADLADGHERPQPSEASQPERVQPQTDVAGSDVSGSAQQPGSDSQPVLPGHSSVQRLVRGTVVYETESGTQRPDRGAKVLALPLKRAGTVRLSVVGFRPADDPADFEVARAALGALGGAATTVDAAGRFSLRLPSPGPYLLLVLSRYQRQPDGQTVPPELLPALKAVFLEPPTRLLGRTAFATRSVPASGTSVAEWTCVFPRP